MSVAVFMDTTLGGGVCRVHRLWGGCVPTLVGVVEDALMAPGVRWGWVFRVGVWQNV